MENRSSRPNSSALHPIRAGAAAPAVILRGEATYEKGFLNNTLDISLGTSYNLTMIKK